MDIKAGGKLSSWRGQPVFYAKICISGGKDEGRLPWYTQFCNL